MPRRHRRRRVPRSRSGRGSKRSGRKDKGIYQRWHARGAAKNRYQLRLSTEDLKAMVDIIHDKDPSTCLKVFNQSNRVSHYVIKWGRTWLPVVYDCYRHNIVTFLPRIRLIEYMERVKGQREYYGEETLHEKSVQPTPRSEPRDDPREPAEIPPVEGSRRPFPPPPQESPQAQTKEEPPRTGRDPGDHRS